ncbi:MAG: tRNA (adenosine(37)-N6)-dimethylallyltransferase MiaA [Lachnospiraceae bacterium]|nr:tRNA (adenosine(37)-N6)-dimethylallyltransferase MiaA [Lachnospiraceae bacterium]
MKKPLVILTGPTAAGKTALSLALAEAAGGEIISADSMQVYRGMDIGSAKLSEKDRRGILHHLLDVKDPSESFDVTEFVRLAGEAGEGIYARGHLPILVGGTGFYLQAFLKGLNFEEGDPDTALRDELNALAERKGRDAVYALLQAEDPEAAAVLHPNNLKRVIRAIEYRRLTGRSISEANKEQQETDSPYNFAYFVLTLPREQLYARIDRRVDEMFDEGLVDEVIRLRESGLDSGSTALQAIGYKEVIDALDGRCTMDEARDAVKLGTRHYAKRQLTWFRREKDVIWLDKSRFADDAAILAEMLRILREKEILP